KSSVIRTSERNTINLERTGRMEPISPRLPIGLDEALVDTRASIWKISSAAHRKDAVERSVTSLRPFSAEWPEWVPQEVLRQEGAHVRADDPGLQNRKRSSRSPWKTCIVERRGS